MLPSYLRSGRKKSNFLPFEEAREYAQKLRLSSKSDWLRWCKDHRPSFIPANPHQAYTREQGWVSLPDWLGYQPCYRRTSTRKGRPQPDPNRSARIQLHLSKAADNKSNLICQIERLRPDFQLMSLRSGMAASVLLQKKGKDLSPKEVNDLWLPMIIKQATPAVLHNQVKYKFSFPATYIDAAVLVVTHTGDALCFSNDNRPDGIKDWGARLKPSFFRPLSDTLDQLDQVWENQANIPGRLRPMQDLLTELSKTKQARLIERLYGYVRKSYFQAYGLSVRYSVKQNDGVMSTIVDDRFRAMIRIANRCNNKQSFWFSRSLIAGYYCNQSVRRMLEVNDDFDFLIVIVQDDRRLQASTSGLKFDFMTTDSSDSDESFWISDRIQNAENSDTNNNTVTESDILSQQETVIDGESLTQSEIIEFESIIDSQHRGHSNSESDNSAMNLVYRKSITHRYSDRKPRGLFFFPKNELVKRNCLPTNGPGFSVYPPFVSSRYQKGKDYQAWQLEFWVEDGDSAGFEKLAKRLGILRNDDIKHSTI